MNGSFDNNDAISSKPHSDWKVERPSDEIEAKEVSHDLASLAGRTAFYYSKKFDSKSRLMKDCPEGTNCPCQLNWSDMKVGDLIGTGSFSHVREVTIVGSCHCYPDSRSSCVRGRQYAVKLLKESIKSKRETFQMGAIGLVNEAKLLPHLNHENIIQLHGTAQGCLSTAYLHSSGYFLLLERLDYTLQDVLKRLRVEVQELSTGASFMKRLRFKGGPELTETQKSQRALRLQDIAIPVASAMQYLHEKRIIYRDLKPANIGFDVNGTLKLFDFGLALEMVENGRQMTPTTGSFRYMSPENARAGDYGFPADVYSFGILLWEVMTLKTPFMDMTTKVFLDMVVKSGVRPKLNKRVGSKSLQTLIQQCWHHSQESRPTFKQVMKLLQPEMSTDNSIGEK